MIWPSQISLPCLEAAVSLVRSTYPLGMNGPYQKRETIIIITEAGATSEAEPELVMLSKVIVKYVF
jgi:hypothetical protein